MSKSDLNIKPDHVTKRFIERPDIFADAINYAIYNGRQVVRPESLEKASTVATSFVYNSRNAAVTFEKIRDVRKVVKLSPADQTAYIIYGVENQSHVHYAMPVKNMLYDIMEYMDQIDTRRLSMHIPIEDRPDNESFSSDEFLSSWSKNDKLIPVFTVVINFSDKKWDGPLSLHEMFDKDPSERYNKVKELIPDYKLILIDPHQMDKTSFSAMKTELNTVLKFIANAKDKAALRKNIGENEFLDADAVAVINSCTGTNISIPDGGEVTMMSEGLRQLLEEEREEERNSMITAFRAVGASEDLIQSALDKMKEMQDNNTAED